MMCISQYHSPFLVSFSLLLNVCTPYSYIHCCYKIFEEEMHVIVQDNIDIRASAEALFLMEEKEHKRAGESRERRNLRRKCREKEKKTTTKS